MNKGRHKEPIIAQPMSSLVPFVLQFTRPAVNSRLTDPASQPKHMTAETFTELYEGITRDRHDPYRSGIRCPTLLCLAGAYIDVGLRSTLRQSDNTHCRRSVACLRPSGPACLQIKKTIGDVCEVDTAPSRGSRKRTTRRLDSVLVDAESHLGIPDQLGTPFLVFLARKLPGGISPLQQLHR